jgi:transposase-like protein
MPEDKKRARLPYPAEVRERAVLMVLDYQHEYAPQWKTSESISAKLSINHETLRIWVTPPSRRRSNSDDMCRVTYGAG